MKMPEAYRYAQTALTWCELQGIGVTLISDVPGGTSMPEEDELAAQICAGPELHPSSLLPRLLRGIGHQLAPQMVPDEDQEEMADLFVTVCMGVLAALEAETVSLEHPAVMAAERLLRNEQDDE